MIEVIARGLEKVSNQFVFVGGAVTELYCDHPGFSEVRPTFDVDCIVHIHTRTEHTRLEEFLRKAGFSHDTSEGAPICRWKYQNVISDIMPVDSSILGFTNRWYDSGFSHRILHITPSGLSIQILPVPYYIGTKIEAVEHREPPTDLRYNHDFEDIIFVLNSHSAIVESIAHAEDEIREYLASKFLDFRNNLNIEEAVSSVMPRGDEGRTSYILSIIKQIALL